MFPNKKSPENIILTISGVTTGQCHQGYTFAIQHMGKVVISSHVPNLRRE